MAGRLDILNKRIIACRRCPRLVRYIRSIRTQFPGYWCKPVPGFGDPRARVFILGLAPGRYGANRTGRIFTGDSSGRFLYPVLHEAGFANQPESETADDGLKLNDAYISCPVRCAPPQNKPNPDEMANCFPYLVEELGILSSVRVVVALGQIAHQSYLKFLRQTFDVRASDYPFGHGAVHRIAGDARILIDSYHPSRQNTQTGKLDRRMFLDIFIKAKQLAAKEPIHQGATA